MTDKGFEPLTSSSICKRSALPKKKIELISPLPLIGDKGLEPLTSSL